MSFYSRYCIPVYCSLITCFFVLLWPSTGIGQEKRIYDSVYQPLPGHTGIARFEYFEDSEGRIIKDGSFQFRSEWRDSTDPTYFVYEKWTGAYRNNLKSGEWTYQKEKQKADIKGVEEGELRYHLKTEKRELRGRYDNNNPVGSWQLGRAIFLNNEKTEETETVNVAFNNKRIDGPVFIEFNMPGVGFITVQGTAKNGLMDSTWLLKYGSGDSTLKEFREYRNGFLLSLQRVNATDTILSLQFPLSSEIRRALQSGGTGSVALNRPVSLAFSDGYPRTSRWMTSQQQGNSYIETALQQLLQYEANFVQQHGLALGSNRGFYLMSTREKNLLEQWPSLEYEYREKVRQLQQFEQDHYKFRDDAAIKPILAWTEKQRYLLEYIKPWNNILSKNELEFHNRNGELVSYAFDLLSTDTLRWNGNQQQVVEYPVSASQRQDFLSYISANFKTRIQAADSLIGLYSDLAQTLMLADEVAMQKKNVDSLKERLTDKMKNPAEPEMKGLLTHLHNSILQPYFDRYFQYFSIAGREAIPQQLAYADSLHYLLYTFAAVHDDAILVSKHKRKIDSLYTEFSFDPFTFNDRVPRRVKKKLYEIVAEDLVDELLAKVAGALTPAEARLRMQQLIEVQERVIFLRDKDTRKLERKLRKNDPIEKKLELLKA